LEVATTQNVGVDVVDGLSTVLSRVEHNAVTLAGFRLGDFGSHCQQVAGKFSFYSQHFDILEVIFRDHEHVRWRFGVDVSKR
jgi:hypothetical protein